MSRTALIRRSLCRRRVKELFLIGIFRRVIFGAPSLPVSIITFVSQTCRQLISSRFDVVRQYQLFRTWHTSWRLPTKLRSNKRFHSQWRRHRFRPALGLIRNCPLLAQSGHTVCHPECPLLGVKRTSLPHHKMSAFDPKRTWRTPPSHSILPL
jgi:hypothetical protein